MKNFDQILGKAQTMINGHLDDYAGDIEKAYIQSDDLTVSLSIKFTPNKDGIKIATGISFSLEKVKDGISIIVDPQQNQMFD